MFESLSQRLGETVKHLRGQGRLTEDNIKDALRDVRMALLEADVALPVVREFIAKVRERAVGQEVLKSLSPGQALVKIVHDELVQVMGKTNEALNLQTQPPAVILLAGLQGAGKTTTAGKLGLWLTQQGRKRVGVVSTDVYRPAAIDQLATVAEQAGVEFLPSASTESPDTIADRALAYARSHHLDALIVDTAGRLHVDAGMMTEVSGLHGRLEPVETLFVVDSMTGQDAVTSAKAFHDALPLTGIILTKTDGDARGGAALSVRHVTGAPIKFLGVGEKTQALEPFYPERVASRILGMGDIVSLAEQAQSQVDHDQADRLAKKLKKGKGFDLRDLQTQLQQMQRMGGMGGFMDKLPGQMAGSMASMNTDDGDREVRRMIAIINSMTPHERRHPALIKASRKRRIAAGSGTQVQDVNRLLKQHTQMQKFMKKASKGGMERMLKQFGQGMGPPTP